MHVSKAGKGETLMRTGRHGSTRPALRVRRKAAWWLMAIVLALPLALVTGGVAVAKDSEGCTICHGDPNFVDPTPGPEGPMSLYVDPDTFAESVHGNNPCSSCHKGFSLTIPQHQEDATKDYRQVAIEACEECHADAFAEYVGSTHAQQFFADQAGPICISCHGSHDIRRVRVGEESADFKMSMAEDSCGRCHQDKFEQASEEFHFRALSLGYERAATCFDCHGWHQNLALHSGDEETVEQCRQCHPGATKGFTYFEMHLEEGFKDAWWGVRAVYLFFSTLLIVVLVIGIAYTTVHFQKEVRIILGRMARGLGRGFGYIQALEEEAVRESVRSQASGEGKEDEARGRTGPPPNGKKKNGGVE